MSNEIKTQEKDKEDYKKYIADYMRLKYHENPVYQRKYKNSLNIKKKYNITPEIWDKYKENLHAIVSLKEIIDELPEGYFERFLLEFKTIKFEKKEKTRA